MELALEQWPVNFRECLSSIDSQRPDVSVIIAFRGKNRLDQLNLVVQSIFGQQGVNVECIVVDLSEQSIQPALNHHVRYQYVATQHLTSAWYKSWAYNLGARMAKSDVLIFHDADIVMPALYARSVLSKLTDEGFQTASLQRFLFYLEQTATARVSTARSLTGARIQCVLQNWTGGTIAVRRDAFETIGGFDEGFVNWGGEDGEFFDRCRAIKQYFFGYIPFWHLWHPPQSGRRAADNLNITTILPARLAISRDVRIAELRARDWANPNRPDPLQDYATQLSEQ